MNSDSSYKILYTETAEDDLKDLPKSIQKRIVNKMRFFASVADPLKFAQPLRDKTIGGLRFRIGDHRVIFEVVAKWMIYHSPRKPRV